MIVLVEKKRKEKKGDLAMATIKSAAVKDACNKFCKGYQSEGDAPLILTLDYIFKSRS